MHHNQALNPYREQVQLIIPGDEEETLSFCIDHFILAANRAIADHGYFFVALSGGSTPKAIYHGLARPENASKIDWKKVLLFWSDERCVSKDNPESNYKMAMEAAFAHLPLKPEHIFPMNGVGDFEKNSLDYEALIRAKVKDGVFDLMMLGVGEDGHTASLFPHSKALEERTRLVVPNFIQEKGVWRLTLSYPCINRAKEIVIYALGKNKAQIVTALFSETRHDTLYPVQRVGSKEHPALWILDTYAAGSLSSQRRDAEPERR